MRLSIIFVSIFLVSCGLADDEQSDYTKSWASVKEVEIVNQQNGKFDFLITLDVPNPCYEYYYREYSIIGTEVEVKYFSKSEGYYGCPEVISTIQINDSFTFESNFQYLFRFWKIEGTYLDTLVYLY